MQSRVTHDVKKLCNLGYIHDACVLKPDDARNKELDVYRMKDCFILRYRAINADNHSYFQLPKGQCLASPSDYGGHQNMSDPSKEGWDARMTMRDAIISVPNKVDSSKRDNIGRSSRCVASRSSAWYFVKQFCRNAVRTQEYSSPSKRRNLQHGATW
jgi:hypothetical protein